MSDIILDSESERTPGSILKDQKRKFLIRTCILSVINILLFTLFIENGATRYDKFLTAAQAFTFSLALLGFLIGAIVAMLPFQGLSYRKKYLRSSLLSMYILNVIFFAGSIFAALVLLWI